MNRSLPDIPNAIISIPLIRNAIEIIIENRTNPRWFKKVKKTEKKKET